MNARRFSLLVTLTFALGLLAPSLVGAGRAEASPDTSKGTGNQAKPSAKQRQAKASAKQRQAKPAQARSKKQAQVRNKNRAKPAQKRRAQARKKRVCTRSGGKQRCRWVARYSGHGVADSKLRTEPLPEPSGDIWLYSVNFREEIKVNIYDSEGELDPAALAQLDGLFRCRRTGEERAVDPRLYEVLSVIYDHFGQQRIELVSGFRNQPNQGSRHFHASAMDIRIPGVSTNKLHQFATSLDTGGMGIGLYPTSGFVHVDWRAPGDKSYRWTDYSGPDEKDSGPRHKRKRRPNT